MSFEETFAKFQKNFEEVTLTLIAAMSKITENLDRVTGAMDLAAKIEIQNLENKQVLQNLEKQFKAVRSEERRVGTECRSRRSQ